MFGLNNLIGQEDAIGVIEMVLVLVEIFIFNISVYNVSIV